MEKGPRLHNALLALDRYNAADTLSRPCALFHVPPAFIRGQLQQALYCALACITTCPDPLGVDAERAWKLWLLLPRMLLHRPGGATRVPKPAFRARFQQFFRGEWPALLEAAEVATPAQTSAAPPQPRQDARADRAVHLAHLGELSAARQALLAEPLAAGDGATLQHLRDPARRPVEPYEPLDPDLLAWCPDSPVELSCPALLTNLRRSRRGAAPGPSGYTAEIVRLILDDSAAVDSFGAVATRLARAQLPATIAQALGLGRLIAIRKPAGGVRGIVVGDYLRRLVARTLAQHFAPAFDVATRPHQYALATRAGTEALAHSLQLECEIDPTLTVLSVDGVGAYDLISRLAMLRALRNTPDAASVLPFVRLFYGQPSTFLWRDDAGVVHRIVQAEGGEQGDPLMPALFALGIAPALAALQAEMHTAERVRAFLDDVYVTSPPPRVAHLLGRLQHHLFAQAHIQLNPSKTRVWNAAGVRPASLPAPAGAQPWVGDPELPAAERGLRVLGTPLGTPEYVAAQLDTLTTQHGRLLARLPDVPDLQVAWLLLLYCALPRAQYVLRVLPPPATRAFSAAHDRSNLSCLATLLRVESTGEFLANELVCGRAQLSLRHGGLGLRSAAWHAPAAYFASWADALQAISLRDPELAATAARRLQRADEAAPSLAALQEAAQTLAGAGFQAPRWDQLAHTPCPLPEQPDDQPTDFTRGWQRSASFTLDAAFAASLTGRLDPSSVALLESQSGPFAAKVLTALPTSPELRLEPASYRVMLLRRLRLQLPLVPAFCPCRRRLDALGDHRASCPRSGLLRSRAVPLERAAARVCREAGATVATNVLLRDLNLVVQRQDERRIEVIANGLPLWSGAQLAVDTTLVSALDSAGQARRHQRSTAGAALRIARKAKERTYPELLRSARCRLVVLGIELGGRWSTEAAQFIRLLARSRARAAPPLLRSSATAAYVTRWSALLSFAAARALAASLLSLPLAHTANVDGDPLDLSDLLGAAHEALPPSLPSRLPPRG